MVPTPEEAAAPAVSDAAKPADGKIRMIGLKIMLFKLCQTVANFLLCDSTSCYRLNNKGTIIMCLVIGLMLSGCLA